MAWVVDEPGAFRVHRAVFTSPAVADLEQQRIFDRCWQYVGHAAEVPAPHAFVRRQVAGRELILIRGGDGEVRVLRNACRHRGAEVCEAPRGIARRFRCRYHGWVYDSTGARLRGPAGDGLEVPPGVAAYRGLVFACFDPGAPPLPEYLAPVRPWLDLVLDQASEGLVPVPGEQRYRAAANWKLLADNSVDVHHVPSLHRRWLASLKEEGVELLGATTPGGAGHGLAFGHAVAEYDAPWGRLAGRWSPDQGAEVREAVEARRAALLARHGPERGARIASRSRNLLIFPNLVINDLMAVTLRRIRPVRPDALEVSAVALAPVDEGASLRALRLDRFLHFLGPAGLAHADDLAILESCQRGMGAVGEGWSDYSRGLDEVAPAAGAEAQMRGFWREWARRMGPPPAGAP